MSSCPPVEPVSEVPAANSRSSFRAWLATPQAMVVIGLTIRLLALTIGHSYRMNPRTDHFGFGWETGRIARAIAEGEGFSSPFHGNTGPTAWVAPLYPYLVAAVFKFFGVYTYGSAWILLAINSFFSALTAWSMYRICEETIGVRVARWAGWTWALLPYAMYWAIRWVWETSFSAFMVSLALLLALRLERHPRMRTWIGFGVIWGVIALANPSCLTLLPCFGLWAAWHLARTRRPWFLGAVVSGAIFLAMLAPWTIRNYEVFGKFIPIRDNFGVEFRLGNSIDADGLWMSWFHPTQDNVQMAKYVQMGEINYVAMRKQEAQDFVKEHPGRFVELCVRRAIWYWIGTPRSSTIPFGVESRNLLFLLSSLLAFWGLWCVLRDGIRGGWLLAFSLLVYPIVYYITFPHPRYRHPIEPEMVITGLYLLSLAIAPPSAARTEA